MKRKSLTLCVSLALLLAGCGGGQIASGITPTPFPTPVRPTFTTQRGDITVEARWSGRVVPLALHTVYFQINGQVDQHVHEVLTLKDGVIVA
ncbi:MAG TPA: hypothetical protein VFZ43_14000 [Anaerolineales bacterium]